MIDCECLLRLLNRLTSASFERESGLSPTGPASSPAQALPLVLLALLLLTVGYSLSNATTTKAEQE
jgi:hypothetical protein